MANPTTFKEVLAQGDVGGGGPDLGPEQEADAIHDGAPGGLTFEGELPSVAVPGGQPFTTNGYTPDGAQDSLPAPGSEEGNGTAPSGIRK
jgi:hypothetical protein